MGIVNRLRNLAKLIDFKIGSNLVSEAADIITRLKGYAAHSDECAINAWMPRGDEPCPPCSCGLSALLEEIDRD